MIARTHGPIASSAASLTLCLALGIGGTAAWTNTPFADTRVTAHYAITMVGVTIGQISWVIDIGAGTYKTAASGKASGALSMLVNGEGRIATTGAIVRSMAENGAAEEVRLAPSFFSSNVTEDGETVGLQMTFNNGTVKTLRSDAPIRENMREAARIPVTEADRHGVSDPLTAMLIGIPPTLPPGQGVLTPAVCNRLLAIYDGQRRYNLALSYKHADRLTIERGYAGPVLVCAVVLQPIAGYRADSMLVKYAGGQRDMEIWFAPIAGTRLIAPVRLLMPTMIGTLEISADRFEAVALKPVPASPAQAPH
jgi:hypothetical protein